MEDLIDQLPDDCLEHIFSFLPIKERLKVEGVCKRWRNIGEEGWPDIKEMKFDYWNSDKMIHLILKRCGRFLKELDISRSSRHPHCLSMIIQFCRLEQLESIAIHGKSAFTERQTEHETYNLRKIFGKAKNLVDVSIYENLEESCIDYLNLVDPTALRKLNIINSGRLVTFNPDRFPNLKCMHLFNIKIGNGELRRDEESLNGLEKFVIHHCHVSRGFIMRIQSFTNLQILDLTHNICEIRNNDIHEIANHCDKMKAMDLADIPSLTSECFQYLGRMPSLEVLRFDSLNILNNHDVLHLTNVKELYFYFCEDISVDDGLIQLITNSPNLEKLKLVGVCGLDMNFINDLQRIFHRGQRQKHLHFRALINPSDEFLGRTFPIVIDEPLLSLKVDLL